MIDRDVDLITPLLVSQNFEGLLDEFFGIQKCSISIDNKIVYPDEAVRKSLNKDENGKTDLLLTNEDNMFSGIRNKHFNSAGPHLNRQILDISRMMNDKSQKSIQDLDNYIKKLKNMNIISVKEKATIHINIAYSIT